MNSLYIIYKYWYLLIYLNCIDHTRLTIIHNNILFIGIPELNIPALEPFLIPEIDLKIFQGLGASIFGNTIQRSNKTKAFARNLVIHHSSEFEIYDLK